MTAQTRRVDTGASHWYKMDGDKVDGVTTVIGDAIPKAALVPWAAKVTTEYVLANWEMLADMPDDERVPLIKGAPSRDRDRNARRGTEVHALAVGLLHGEQVDVPDELVGHVDSYVKFLGDWDVQPVVSEAVVGHRTHKWMGTLDAIGDFGDGLRRLYDIKTTRSGIFAETAIQVGTYRAAEFYLDPYGQERPMIPVDACAAVWIRADGYDLYPLDTSHAYRTFRHAQRIAQWQNDLGRDAVGDALIAPEPEAA